VNRTATPCIKPWYRRVYPSTDEVVFVSGDHAVTLQGGAVQPLVRPLLALLDGTRTLDEIIGLLGETAAPAIEHAVDILAERQLLLSERAVSDELPAQALGTASFLAAAYGAGQDVRPLELARAVEGARVLVVGGTALAAEVAAVLDRSGVAVGRLLGHSELLTGRESFADVDALVAAPAPAEEAAALADINRWALGRDLAWMPVAPFNGRYVAVGPIFVPPLSGCYACYLHRRWNADDVAALTRSVTDIEQSPAFHSPAIDAAACGIAAALLLRWLVLRDPFVVGRMFTLTFGRDLELRGHPVLRLPRCPECSLADAAASSIITWFESDGDV